MTYQIGNDGFSHTSVRVEVGEKYFLEAKMDYKVGDEVRVTKTYGLGEGTVRPGREAGEVGVIKEILGARPTYRVAFGHGRDAFLCENSLARTK
jgi:hypothetical protein